MKNNILCKFIKYSAISLVMTIFKGAHSYFNVQLTCLTSERVTYNDRLRFRAKKTQSLPGPLVDPEREIPQIRGL